MAGQAPGGADKRGTIYAGNISAWGVMGTYVACEHATLDLATNLFERTETSPTIRDTAHLLPKLSVQIGGASRAARITRADGIRVRAIGTRIDCPLDAFERKRRFDDPLPG